jgi:hypothetical protein
MSSPLCVWPIMKHLVEFYISGFIREIKFGENIFQECEQCYKPLQVLRLVPLLAFSTHLTD